MKFLNGRTNRASYWLSLAILAVLLTLVALYNPSLARVNEVVLIFLCVPRLHDIGRSGWWTLGIFAIELVGALVGFGLFHGEASVQVMGGFVLIIFGIVFWLGFLPGVTEANQFGDPPAPGLGRRPKSNDA
jgi:uncharacterized membrane protein YhaH (DUF805 family)